jgi:hypothetical protein
MEFSGSAFLPGARGKRKGFLEGKPPNLGEPLLPRFALLTDDLLIVNVPSLTGGVVDQNAEWPRNKPRALACSSLPFPFSLAVRKQILTACRAWFHHEKPTVLRDVISSANFIDLSIFRD